MSFSSGGDLGGYRTVVSALLPLRFLGIFLTFILIAKILKKRWLGSAKMAQKIEFFKLWRALVSDLDFSSFFLNFVPLALGTFVKDF